MNNVDRLNTVNAWLKLHAYPGMYAWLGGPNATDGIVVACEPHVANAKMEEQKRDVAAQFDFVTFEDLPSTPEGKMRVFQAPAQYAILPLYGFAARPPSPPSYHATHGTGLGALDQGLLQAWFDDTWGSIAPGVEAMVDAFEPTTGFAQDGFTLSSQNSGLLKWQAFFRVLLNQDFPVATLAEYLKGQRMVVTACKLEAIRVARA